MRILGVDPGTLRLGFGVLDDNSGSPICLDSGCLTAERGWPLHRRLYWLHQQLREVMERWAPEQLAVEEPFVNVERGAKSAVAVGQAQAVALLLAAEAGLEVYRYSPTQVKRAVGDYGAATKGQVQRVLQMVLGLEPVPMQEDASDALAVALCHLRHWNVSQRVRQA